MLTLNDGRSELWQWDTGRTLSVDADCSQVHFSNKVFGRSIDVDVVGGKAIIPDVLLQTEKDLNVWAFVGTAENGYTKISKTFKVNRRNKPADYVFTPQEQITLKDATAILEEAKEVANMAIDSAEQAEDIANKATKIADEMKRLADQVEQNTETATKAKADALTAQAKAEEARNAAEIAKKAAEDAANSAGTDASAASSAATRAQNAANDASAAMDSIRVLYQDMQEYVSQSIQDIQTEGNTQVQRVADEGAAQISAAKEQADRAQAEADRAEAARANAEEVVESCIPDDAAVNGKPWTSKKIVDTLCQPIEESGNPVQCYPVEHYPLGVTVRMEPIQEGSGDPSPENVRPITGRDAVSVTRVGRNLLDPLRSYVYPANPYGLTIEYLGNNTVHIKGFPTLTADLQFVALRTEQTDISAKGYIISTFTDGDISVNNSWGLRTKEEKSLAISVPGEIGKEIDGTVQFMVSVDKMTAYEPYRGDAYEIAMPETVYGGELDMATGVLTVEFGTKALDGTEPWSYTQANNGSKLGTNVLNGKASGEQYVSSHFKKSKTINEAIQNGSGIVIYESGYIDIAYSSVTNKEEWKAYLAAQYTAGTPVEIAYTLEAPYTIQLTPQQITALSGVNTIYTDADGVIVTGRENPQHTITELKNAIISLGGNV